MTTYELISLLVSILSVIIAVTAMMRTRKIAEEQLNLERITAELSKKQLEELELTASKRDLPKLKVDLDKLGKDYNFFIMNRGQGSAYDLHFELIDCSESPISTSDLREKFPFPELKPDSRVKLLAGIHMNSPRQYHVRLKWKSSNKDEQTEDFHVSI